MNSQSSVPEASAQSPNPLANLELWLGSIVGGLGAALIVAWQLYGAEDRHGMVFAFLGALFLFPLGLSLIVAALVLRRGGRHRWIAQLGPIVWVLAYVIGFKTMFLP